MTDIDRILEAIFKNPYEKSPRRQHTCAKCGEGIFKGDNFYIIGGNDYCEKCVGNAKVLG